MRSVRLLLAGAVSLFFLVPADRAGADTITLRADEWCPYNCALDEERPGYGIEIAREIFAAAGHVIDYKLMPWARALEECRKGTIDAVIGTNPNESADFVFPQLAIGMTDNTLVVRKGNPWRFDGVGSLAGLKLGVVQGYTYDGRIGAYIQENAANRARIDGVGGDNALEQNLKKLQIGRIDATIDTMAVLVHRIGKLGIGDKVQFAGTADPGPIYIAFSPAKPEASKAYAALVDRGLAQLRQSGRLAAIIAKYGIADWK